MTATAATPKALAADDGIRLQSGPGRDLVFKLTGEDTRGALDYFICEVAPHGDHRFTCTTTRTRRSTSSPVASRSELTIRSTPSTPAASPTYPPACRMRS